MSSNVAQAEQQKWASQYIHWKFDKQARNIVNIDQEIWIKKPNNSSFWPLQWSWEGSNGVGGYMGLQQGKSKLNQVVRFSLWNATDVDITNAQGATSRKFGGEGIGYTCTLPFTINPNKFYTYRLLRLNEDTDGQWWGAWLIESDKNEKLMEHPIGKIKVPKKWKHVDINSISNFVEYYGNQVDECKKVPPSVVGFEPPSVNYKSSGNYAAYSTFSHSKKASKNRCTNGSESNGALIYVQKYNFKVGKGVMVFLGGSSDESKEKPSDIDIPKVDSSSKFNFITWIGTLIKLLFGA